MNITKPRLSITDNYNDDFNEIHQTIFKRLSRKNDKGLVLLHGKPGTGKTSKGRLIAKYEFKELEANKAQILSNKLGFSTSLSTPMTLAAIYNQEETDFHQIKRRNSIGFKPQKSDEYNPEDLKISRIFEY